MVIALNRHQEANADLIVSDIPGRKVFSRPITLSDKPQTFLPLVNEGIYFVTVKGNNISFVRKIAIKCS